MSLKERLKKGLRKLGAAVAPGAAAGLAAGKAAKKKKLRAGMMKATGQSKDSAAAVKRRTDIAAMRASAKRKGQVKAYADAGKKVMASAKTSVMMKKEKKPLK